MNIKNLKEGMVIKNLKCVYAIKNEYNGKVYIGSTINLDSRLKSHIKKLEEGTHHNTYLQKSWQINSHNFYSEILEIVDDVSFLPYAELYYIEKFKRINGVYNFSNPLEELKLAIRREKSEKKVIKKRKKKDKPIKVTNADFKEFIESNLSNQLEKIKSVLKNKEITLLTHIVNYLQKNISDIDANSPLLSNIENYTKYYLRKNLDCRITTLNGNSFDSEKLKKYNLPLNGELYVVKKNIYDTFLNVIVKE